MDRSPGSLEGLRLGNRLRVLEVLRQRGTASRVDVVRATGLSRTTVSSLVCQLLEDAVLIELPERASAASAGGRPATLLALNPSAGGVVGVHIGHDHVRVAVTDLAGDVLAETLRDIDVDHQPEDSLEFAATSAVALIDQAGLHRPGMIGLGVAVSAPVQLTTHAFSSPALLPDWTEVDVAGELGRRTGLRVEVGNDANLGAIAERRYGVGRGVDDFIYVMLSDGVGAGLVLNGHLYEGATGGAGEIGHVTVVTDGYICRCGNRGCLETVAGTGALTTALSMTRGPGTTLADLLTLATSKDPGARRVLADAGRAVGRALAGLCTVLDPRLVIIGGKGAAAGEPLLEGVREALARNVTPMKGDPIPVVAGALGERAEVLGAIALVSQNMTLH